MTVWAFVGLVLQFVASAEGRKLLATLLSRHENFVAELKELHDSRVRVKNAKGYD